MVKWLFGRLLDYVSTSNHYRWFIHQHTIHINNRTNNVRYELYKIPISLLHLVFPTFITFVFGVRAFLVLHYKFLFVTPYSRLLFFTELMNEDFRDYIEYCILFWSINHVLHTFYVLRAHIVKYKFFAVLVCELDDPFGITPKALGY